MVQSIDNDFFKPVYNAVNIKIRKPTVNAEQNNDNCQTCVNTDNGIYNAVKIDIDKPTVNTQPRRIYDYPESNSIITYDMIGIQPVALPDNTSEDYAVTDKNNTENNDNKEAVVPEENFTTLEAEKIPFDKKEISEPEYVDEETQPETIESQGTELSFHGVQNVKKKPEIVPSVDIKPDVNIAEVSENLKSNNFDVQAVQIAKIVALAGSKDKKDKLNDYLVSDVITNLIDITKADTTKLVPPTNKQVDLRNKIKANIAALDKGANENSLPNKLSKEDIEYAIQLSPMEMAERNKEYAVMALAVLANTFIDEKTKLSGAVPPITDVPGVSAIVDVIRYSPNTSLKIIAIESLLFIQKPEYKEQLSEIYKLAINDSNKNVASIALSAYQYSQQHQK